jgi:hypothetical protein
MIYRFAALVILVAACAVHARVAAPPPIAMSVATADAVFVGQVTGFGDKMVPGDLEKGDSRMMQLAEVTVSDDLMGKVGKKVTVGFFPSGGRRPGVQLEPKDKALFLVRKHPTRKNTYVAEMYYSAPREKGNPQFATQVAEAKAAAKAISAPLDGLKSKDGAERYRTAALLLLRYRTPPPGEAPKTEKVPAEESKLLLMALAEADWNPGRGDPFGGRVPPQSVFFRLGLQPADGWTPPKELAKVPEAARKWLTDNAGKYQVVRYVRPVAKGGEGEP